MLDFLLPAFMLGGYVEAAALFPNTTTGIITATTSRPPSITSAWDAQSTSFSCLYPVNPILGNVGNHPDTDCMRPGNPVLYRGGSNPYDVASEWDPSMAASCSSLYTSSHEEFKKTGVVTSYQVTLSGTKSTADLVRTHIQYESVFEWAPWELEQPSKCCLNCTVYAGHGNAGVRVFHWPTLAPTPAVTALVDDQNFIFIYPSVYVAFQTLEALDLCGDVGPTYTSTTLAFTAGELKTDIAWTAAAFPPPSIKNDWTTADWNSVGDCKIQTSTLIQNFNDGEFGAKHTYTNWAEATAACPGTKCWLINHTIHWNPCSPTLSVPTQIFTLNPLWKNCMTGMDPFFDPPYTLTAGRGFRPLTITGPGASATPPATTAVHPQPVNTRPLIPGPTKVDPPPTTAEADTETLIWSPIPFEGRPLSPSRPGDPPSPIAIMIGTQTLTAGAAPVTISSHVYSLAPAASEIVIDGTQTIVAGGPAITATGTVISLLFGGSSVVVGGTTRKVGGLIEVGPTNKPSGYATPTTASPLSKGSATSGLDSKNAGVRLWSSTFGAGAMSLGIAIIIML